jgi:hypothetical protein
MEFCVACLNCVRISERHVLSLGLTLTNRKKTQKKRRPEFPYDTALKGKMESPLLELAGVKS